LFLISTVFDRKTAAILPVLKHEINPASYSQKRVVGAFDRNMKSVMPITLIALHK